MKYVIPRIPRDLFHPTPPQATEDNEMTLIEGEQITQIDEIDDGWWSGVGPGGKSGLFPCNARFSKRDIKLTDIVVFSQLR